MNEYNHQVSREPFQNKVDKSWNEWDLGSVSSMT